MSKPKGYRLSTTCVHTGAKKDPAWGSVATPIYPTSTFAFVEPGRTTGYDYTRSGNPTRAALEENLAAIEGGTLARATCTGMSAITTVLFMFRAGDHLIAGHDIYGGTFRLLSSVANRHGIDVSFVDMRDPANVAGAIRPTTRGIWIETPSNPLLNIVDIAAVVEIARKKKLVTIADNTFCTPVLQRPLDLGVDVVVHSTTKYLNGHSDVVGGAIIARDAKRGADIAYLTNALGTACSPFDAYLVLRGIKTLPLRMAAHQENAQAVAEFLATHRKVKHVYYPGLEDHPQYDLGRRQMAGPGGMMSFDIAGGAKAADAFVRRVKLFTLAESLGGVHSLLEIPATMSHASMTAAARKAAGITPANIRLSIGIEAKEDLIADLDEALAAI
ncbi:MAG: aminotransferase class I/II-fold pyridoxal phosphate-dependent enzyme [Deltaproteobacteria bacterium]|nr:aminotransferase class I/II-fold pyridoxal phosphate-dependent enzyme [Deltaproteobacteria bacterium]